MHNTLESHKFFPYVAWTLVVGFAIFTYLITVRVQAQLSEIGAGVTRLETEIDSLKIDKKSPPLPR
jgi:hypothetical protein